MNIKISEDENTIEVDGKILEAVENDTDFCASICEVDVITCLSGIPCIKGLRKDKRNVIFKEVKE